MMGALGKWVLQEAARQMSVWQKSGLYFPGRLAFNLSARQLEEANIASKFDGIVREAGLTSARFELELTESAPMRHVDEAIETLVLMKKAGFSVAIDDFGTGYSSLTYLKRLPADTLKIDVGFVRDMLKNRADLYLVTAIIGMARHFGLKSVAEGVEEAAQAAALLELGCDEAQGYYFGRPEPAHVFAQNWLQANRPSATVGVL